MVTVSEFNAMTPQVQQDTINNLMSQGGESANNALFLMQYQQEQAGVNTATPATAINPVQAQQIKETQQYNTQVYQQYQAEQAQQPTVQPNTNYWTQTPTPKTIAKSGMPSGETIPITAPEGYTIANIDIKKEEFVGPLLANQTRPPAQEYLTYDLIPKPEPVKQLDLGIGAQALIVSQIAPSIFNAFVNKGIPDNPLVNQAIKMELGLAVKAVGFSAGVTNTLEATAYGTASLIKSAGVSAKTGQLQYSPVKTPILGPTLSGGVVNSVLGNPSEMQEYGKMDLSYQLGSGLAEVALSIGQGYAAGAVIGKTSQVIKQVIPKRTPKPTYFNPIMNDTPLARNTISKIIDVKPTKTSSISTAMKADNAFVSKAGMFKELDYVKTINKEQFARPTSLFSPESNTVKPAIFRELDYTRMINKELFQDWRKTVKPYYADKPLKPISVPKQSENLATVTPKSNYFIGSKGSNIVFEPQLQRSAAVKTVSKPFKEMDTEGLRQVQGLLSRGATREAELTIYKRGLNLQLNAKDFAVITPSKSGLSTAKSFASSSWGISPKPITVNQNINTQVKAGSIPIINTRQTPGFIPNVTPISIIKDSTVPNVNIMTETAFYPSSQVIDNTVPSIINDLIPQTAVNTKPLQLTQSKTEFALNPFPATDFKFRIPPTLDDKNKNKTKRTSGKRRGKRSLVRKYPVLAPRILLR